VPTTPSTAGQTTHRPPVPAPAGPPLERPRTRLVLSSALMLMLELALIRWTGANIVHLSYFANFVLLGSFLGIGLGFLRVRPGRPLRRPLYSPVALALLVGFVHQFPVVVDRTDQQVIYFTSISATGPPIWVTLPVIFLAVAVILMGPGELVAGCFLKLERLEAYRYDLVGSLIGIGGFTAVSYLNAPPVVWGVIVAALYVGLLGWGPFLLVPLAGAVLVTVLALETATPGVSWSPYYKVSTWEREGALHVHVNGIPHQQITTAEESERTGQHYTVPYERARGNALGDVLIIGAGTGSDVAVALGRGAKHVDAVEIDPQLQRIGVTRNPDRPYDDPRVDVHVDDGRAFHERTDQSYDLILFALPDSLTLVQGASSLRLESYLFTAQAMTSAREHLRPGGAFAMYNFYREAWLVDRLARTLAESYGHAPCVDVMREDGQKAVLTVAVDAARQACPVTRAGLSGPAPATDDRPFLYLRETTVPRLYLVTLAAILLVSLAAIWLVAGRRRRGPSSLHAYADLFLLGAGFLLLETKSVTGFALLFGTTWVVNAVVFAGVLVAVLLAVEVTRRRPTPSLPVVYAFLGAGLLLAWAVPSSWLLSLPLPLRAATAVTIAFLPIFAANVVFAKRFASTADPTTAFGANLLGAMFGGCLEYAALVVGYRGLLVLAGLLYVGALVLLPRTRTPVLTR